MTKGWGYVAALALLPYAIIKSIWAWGSTVLLTTKQAVQGVAGFGDTLKEGSAFLYTLYTIGIDFTAILAILQESHTFVQELSNISFLNSYSIA